MGYHGNRLRELRDSKKLSGVDVAEAVNITPQYYYELEKGTKRLNEDLLRRFAKYYNTTTDHILRLGSSTPPDPDIKDAPLAFAGNTEGLSVDELKKIIGDAVNDALDERERKRKENREG